jgi:outer membrane protein TolC
VVAPACSTVDLSAVRDPYAEAPASAAVPWTPAPSELPPRATPLGGAAPLPDLQQVYDVPALIDLAERTNPETRVAWEEARAAAARLGIAEGTYLPALVLAVPGGYAQSIRSTAFGTENVHGASLRPELTLSWLLLDFGRRGADVERARQELLGSNLSFTRKHQEIVYAVERSVYAYDASRARVHAAEATLASATALRGAAEERRRVGLATSPEMLLAREEEARAAYELQDAQGTVEDTYARLAEGLGISPTTRLQTSDLSAQPLPPELTETVERVIDRALVGRPDLAAHVAALRAREAGVRRAQAEFLPKINLRGNLGGAFADYRGGPPFSSFTDSAPTYGAFLTLDWALFEGYQRENALREAESGAGAAQAELATTELRVLREVWKAYADVKTSVRKYEFATALLKAAEDAYAASLAGYRSGVGNFLDLLAGERDLARARYMLIESRADLLTASAALSFATGGSGVP